LLLAVVVVVQVGTQAAEVLEVLKQDLPQLLVLTTQ
jgi:hypothetical protein